MICPKNKLCSLCAVSHHNKEGGTCLWISSASCNVCCNFLVLWMLQFLVGFLFSEDTVVWGYSTLWCVVSWCLACWNCVLSPSSDSAPPAVFIIFLQNREQLWAPPLRSRTTAWHSAAGSGDSAGISKLGAFRKAFWVFLVLAELVLCLEAV